MSVLTALGSQSPAGRMCSWVAVAGALLWAACVAPTPAASSLTLRGRWSADIEDGLVGSGKRPHAATADVERHLVDVPTVDVQLPDAAGNGAEEMREMVAQQQLQQPDSEVLMEGRPIVEASQAGGAGGDVASLQDSLQALDPADPAQLVEMERNRDPFAAADDVDAEIRREKMEDFMRQVEAIKESLAGNKLYAQEEEEDYYNDDLDDPEIQEPLVEDVVVVPEVSARQITWLNPFTRHVETKSKPKRANFRNRISADKCIADIRRSADVCRHLPVAMGKLCRRHQMCTACAALQYGPNSMRALCDSRLWRDVTNTCPGVDDVTAARAPAMAAADVNLLPRPPRRSAAFLSSNSLPPEMHDAKKQNRKKSGFRACAKTCSRIKRTYELGEF